MGWWLREEARAGRIGKGEDEGSSEEKYSLILIVRFFFSFFLSVFFFVLSFLNKLLLRLSFLYASASYLENYSIVYYSI